MPTRRLRGKHEHGPQLPAAQRDLATGRPVGSRNVAVLSATIIRRDWLGSTEPAFSQGALSNFRGRLIHHDMDQRLLERNVEIARRSTGAPLLLGSSIKRECDLEWSDPAQKRGAIVTLVE
jgi:hypothetical protein